MKFISYIDILGFSELVRKNRHAEVKALITRIYERLNNFQLTHNEYITQKDFKVDMRLSSLAFSDTILLWTQNDHTDAFQNIVGATSLLLSQNFADGLPSRAYVSKGEFDYLEFDTKSQLINKSFGLVGLGLVEAYYKEGLQNWSGGYVSEALMTELLEVAPNEEGFQGANFLLEERRLIPYQIPLKGQKTFGYAINWVPMLKDLNGIREFLQKGNPSLIDFFNMYNRTLSENSEKYVNTKEFYEYINRTQSAGLPPRDSSE